MMEILALIKKASKSSMRNLSRLIRKKSSFSELKTLMLIVKTKKSRMVVTLRTKTLMMKSLLRMRICKMVLKETKMNMTMRKTEKVLKMKLIRKAMMSKKMMMKLTKTTMMKRMKTTTSPLKVTPFLNKNHKSHRNSNLNQKPRVPSSRMIQMSKKV